MLPSPSFHHSSASSKTKPPEPGRVAMHCVRLGCQLVGNTGWFSMVSTMVKCGECWWIWRKYWFTMVKNDGCWQFFGCQTASRSTEEDITRYQGRCGGHGDTLWLFLSVIPNQPVGQKSADRTHHCCVLTSRSYGISQAHLDAGWILAKTAYGKSNNNFETVDYLGFSQVIGDPQISSNLKRL